MDTIGNLLIKEVSENRSPSVQYACFDKSNIIKRYAFGFADIKAKKEPDNNTTYNAYSVTKTFTALAVLQLARKGKIDINHAVKEYLTDFPYNPEITVKQLLTHSAGIPNPIPLGWIHLSNDKNFSRDIFFKNLIDKKNKAGFRPNEKFAYSNLGYVLLGQIIEKVSGLKYETYIQANILDALGLPESELGFEIYDYSRHAKGYHKRFSFSNLILGLFIDKSEYMDESLSRWKPFKPFYVNGSAYGGLIGTPDAFIRYIQELLNPDSVLISSDYKKMLFTENCTSSNKPTGMCLSWFKGNLNGHNYFAHAGGGGGYYCEIRIYPDMESGSTVFFNRTGMSNEKFLDRIDKVWITGKM